MNNKKLFLLLVLFLSVQTIFTAMIEEVKMEELDSPTMNPRADTKIFRELSFENPEDFDTGEEQAITPSQISLSSPALAVKTEEEVATFPSAYQPNNVVEITGDLNSTLADIDTNLPKTVKDLLVYLLPAMQDPLFNTLTTALQSKKASIIVTGHILYSWIKFNEKITEFNADKLKLAKKNMIAKALPEVTQDYAALINKQHEETGLFQENLINDWLIFHIKDTNLFLLIPNEANSTAVEQYFCIRNRSICQPMQTKEMFSTVLTFQEKMNRTNNLKKQAKKQPKNKHMARAIAKKTDNYKINFYALSRIYQPNSRGWIFFRIGHGLPASGYNIAPSCGIDPENNYNRAKFLGTTIKTIANFDLTCFGGAEQADQMAQTLVMLSKNKEFTPYIYGIYALTAESVGISIGSFGPDKFNDFFRELRTFEKTKKINEFTKTIENLFSFTPLLKEVTTPIIVPSPSSVNDGTSAHPLIFIPGMKAFTALPSRNFAVFNDPKAKPITQDKKTILLYTQEIEEINLQTTTIPQIIGPVAQNQLPHIISMCAMQNSSLDSEKRTDIARFHEIKKLTTPTTLDQLVIQSFGQSNDANRNFFLIHTLHARDEQNDPIILYDACIGKWDNSYLRLTYKELKPVKSLFNRWQPITKEPHYQEINYINNGKGSEKPISKETYDKRLNYILSFKAKKNPQTYQKPLRALNRFVQQKTEQDDWYQTNKGDL